MLGNVTGAEKQRVGVLGQKSCKYLDGSPELRLFLAYF